MDSQIADELSVFDHFWGLALKGLMNWGVFLQVYIDLISFGCAVNHTLQLWLLNATGCTSDVLLSLATKAIEIEANGRYHYFEPPSYEANDPFTKKSDLPPPEQLQLEWMYLFAENKFLKYRLGFIHDRAYRFVREPPWSWKQGFFFTWKS